VDKLATCDPVAIIRCSDCNLDIYQTRQIGLIGARFDLIYVRFTSD
jgi:hypothetical protein